MKTIKRSEWPVLWSRDLVRTYIHFLREVRYYSRKSAAARAMRMPAYCDAEAEKRFEDAAQDPSGDPT